MMTPTRDQIIVNQRRGAFQDPQASRKLIADDVIGFVQRTRRSRWFWGLSWGHKQLLLQRCRNSHAFSSLLHGGTECTEVVERLQVLSLVGELGVPGDLASFSKGADGMSIVEALE